MRMIIWGFGTQKKHMLHCFFFLTVPFTPLANKKGIQNGYNIYLTFHLGYEPTLIQHISIQFSEFIACHTIMSSISHTGQNFSLDIQVERYVDVNSKYQVD